MLQKPQISYAAPFQHAAAAVTYSGLSEHVAPAPVVENMIPVTAVSCASPARAVNAAPAPDVEHISHSACCDLRISSSYQCVLCGRASANTSVLRQR